VPSQDGFKGDLVAAIEESPEQIRVGRLGSGLKGCGPAQFID
jgi:hypothetical protein